MPVRPLQDSEDNTIIPAGHVVGFVDSQNACDSVTQALAAAGFPESGVSVLAGEEGVQLLKRSMAGSLWGEAAEHVLEEGVAELNHGHLVLFIETGNRNQAISAANVATAHGGHGFSHFGVWTDERLTK